MATITRRKAGYQAQVRHTGYPALSKCFTTLRDAEKWARQIENELDRGIFLDLATGRHRNGLPVILALLVVALVALSRLYLQVHFPSDVLFGLMAAAVWTGGLYYGLARTP